MHLEDMLMLNRFLYERILLFYSLLCSNDTTYLNIKMNFYVSVTLFKKGFHTYHYYHSSKILKKT